MPTYTSWPAPADLTNRLTALGSSLPTGLTAAEVLDRAAEEWERRTKWKPFLAESSDSTTWFDYVGGQLDLRGGYVSFTSVTVNVDSSYPGDVLTLNEQWFPLPSHAPSVERPYTEIGFDVSPVRLARSIKVVGKRGYSATIPFDAWEAVLDWAVRYVLTFSAGVQGQVTEFQQDTVRKKFSSSQGDGTLDRLKANFERAVGRYKRAFC